MTDPAQERFNRSIYKIVTDLYLAVKALTEAVPPVEKIDEVKERLEWTSSEIQSARQFPGSDPA